MSAAPLLFAFVSGGCLGALYFVVLWASVRRLTAGGSAFAFAILAISRLAIALLVIAVVVGARLPAAELLAGCMGFLASRIAATRTGSVIKRTAR